MRSREERRAIVDAAVGVVAVLFVGAVSSCRPPFVGTADIDVRIPPLSEDYGELAVGWNVRWWDGRSVRRLILGPGAAESSRRLSLETAFSGADVVIVAARAEPYLDGANEDGIVHMKPVGAWTAHPSRGLDLSLELGALVETLLDAAERGLDPALVHMKRLEDEVRRVCVDDPSSLDGDRLLKALLTGAMTRYDVSRRERPEVVIRLPSDRAAAWYSDDALEGLAEGVAAEGSVYWTIAVGSGEVRRYWRAIAEPSESEAVATPVRFWEIVTVGRASNGHAHWYMVRRPPISPPH